MNRVILIGRITKEPELKRTGSDIPYVQFTLAVNRSYQNRNGERQADFINCVAWRQTAELITKYIHKGAQFGLEGQIQTRQYDDPNGITRYITEVLCESIHFLEPKRQDEYGFQPPMDDQPYMNRSQPSYQRNNNQPQNSTFRREEKPTKQESPFENLNNQFDISNDDLPF
ncbi:MAG: single-stranded DNA-binding protein [Bacilli bacterium]|jgi:single-strand DNA-binding protein|nr:single-stranded DNA-binding protein [Bacilli bacterium]MDY0064348.1 single-stranded DNA-binding protein [Bacilli bacterium]